MTHDFDKDYWESHWQQADSAEPGRVIDAHPYLAAETRGLGTGTALDAGCGEGAEAVWLAAAGWQVTAADISAGVLSRAARRAKDAGVVSERLLWVEADLTTWEPEGQFDLVTTHYAHPAISQLAFYVRISRWVAPGGTLLIVGHLLAADGPADAHEHSRSGQHGRHGLLGDHDPQAEHAAHADHRQHGQLPRADPHQHPPEEASATAAGITAVLDPGQWEVVTAKEVDRTMNDGSSRAMQLRDVVVRARRR